MKIELHLHTRRYSQCSAATPYELMGKLTELGYGAVYITEHDAVWSDWELSDLSREFGRIHIFPGMELTLGPYHQHVLVLGSNDERYLRYHDEKSVLDKTRDEGHLTVLAHPYRWENAAKMLSANLLPDALEARTCNQNAQQAALATEMATRLGLATTNAGDVHALDMCGKYWIETAAPIEKADDIRDIILMGAYRNCVGEGL